MPPDMPAAKFLPVAQHDHPAAGHVLAAVIADAQHHGIGSAVADGEASAGQSAEKGLAARRPVQGHVAEDDVLARHELRSRRRHQDQAATGQSLADVIVRVPLQHQGDARRQEVAEALTRRTAEPQPDRVVRQPAAPTFSSPD